MRNLILFTLILVSSFSFGQTFDFGCSIQSIHKGAFEYELRDGDDPDAFYPSITFNVPQEIQDTRGLTRYDVVITYNDVRLSIPGVPFTGISYVYGVDESILVKDYKLLREWFPGVTSGDWGDPSLLRFVIKHVQSDEIVWNSNN